MEKAYALGELVTKLKARGLDVVEDSAKIMVEETFAWLKESADLSATPIDNLLASLYPTAQAYITSTVDKIDGKVG